VPAACSARFTRHLLDRKANTDETEFIFTEVKFIEECRWTPRY
jgi:hypothetical protein